jgi:uncharacterized protein YbjT (DUF2867 family)
VSLLVLGASGYVGRQLHALGRFADATWAGRKPDCPIPGYVALSAYDEASLAPHVKQHDAILALMALTRGRREAAMQEGNVEPVRRLAATAARENPSARLLFLSSDLASHALSPYGRAKRDAEGLLAGSGLDAVSVRASAIAGPPLAGLDSSMAKLKRMSAHAGVLAPDGGRFALRPLWIEDLAAVLERFAQRQGRGEDRGSWSAYGPPIGYDELIRAFGAQAGRTPRIVNLPAALLRMGGRVLTALRPDSAFPLDFLEVIGRGARHPPDAFAHLGLAPRPPTAWLGKV